MSRCFAFTYLFAYFLERCTLLTRTCGGYVQKRFSDLKPGTRFRFPSGYNHREDIDPNQTYYVVGPKFDSGRNEARVSLSNPRVYVPPDLEVVVVCEPPETPE